RVDDVSRDQRYLPLRAEVRSELCVPLKVGQQIIGVINVESAQLAAYTAEDQRLLETVAAQIAIAIQNARLYAETNRRAEELEAINRISNTLRSATDLQHALPILLEETLKAVQAPAGTIRLYDEQAGCLRAMIALGWPAEHQTACLRPGEGIAGWVFQRGERYISREFRSDPYIHPPAEGEIPAGWGGVCLPVKMGEEVMGVLLVSKPTTQPLSEQQMNLLEAIADIAGVALHRLQLFAELQQANRDLQQAYDATIEGWARALEYRDQATEGHSQRVTALTLQLASTMGVPEEELPHIYRGALLHDIGKMGIPDHILRKAGPLDEEEWALMKQHPVFAHEMLAGIEYLRPALDIPYCHHERWDGSGYPRGLKGEQIPLAARIFAVVDVYDALTSDRPYREAWTHEQAVNYLRDNAGKLFDPDVVAEFLKILGARNNGTS
ncbi:MAG: HD domain-containing protein, partial [Anaerolineae bacterium]